MSAAILPPGGSSASNFPVSACWRVVDPCTALFTVAFESLPVSELVRQERIAPQSRSQPRFLVVMSDHRRGRTLVARCLFPRGRQATRAGTTDVYRTSYV